VQNSWVLLLLPLLLLLPPPLLLLPLPPLPPFLVASGGWRKNTWRRRRIYANNKTNSSSVSIHNNPNAFKKKKVGLGCKNVSCVARWVASSFGLTEKTPAAPLKNNTLARRISGVEFEPHLVSFWRNTKAVAPQCLVTVGIRWFDKSGCIVYPKVLLGPCKRITETPPMTQK